MKNTLAIAYNGGAYGTYLEWAIATLLSDDQIQEPFTSVGNSHNSKLGHFCTLQEIETYVNSNEEHATFRFHPKTEKSHSVRKNLEIVIKDIKGLVLLYPDRLHELMGVCNYMTKIWQGDFFDGAMKYINPNDIYNGYGIDPATPLKNLPVWIRREHMSLNLFNSWHDQVEWYFPDTWSHPRAMIVTTTDLFYNFEEVLHKIQSLTNMKFLRDIREILPYHDHMISLQKNLGKDKLCKQILDSVLRQGPTLTWDDLCIVSQAWIQYQLRNQGYEIQCHNLNGFPTDTQSLQSLVYQTR